MVNPTNDLWDAWQATRNQAQPDDENSVEYWKSYSKSQDHSYDLLRREVKKLRAANITHTLPTPAVMPSELLPNAGGVLGGLYTADQMHACRESALDEAVDIASKTCHHESTEFANGFNRAAISIEKDIRSLK